MNLIINSLILYSFRYDLWMLDDYLGVLHAWKYTDYLCCGIS